MRSFRVLALATTLAAGILSAQVSGRVTGSVVDASGAGVPKANVSLQLPGSGSAVYSTVTNGDGDFNIASVNPATYDLVVESQGFMKSVLGGVKIDTGRVYDAPQIKLELAGVTQMVEVVTASDAVQTSNVEISNTITKAQIRNLPVIGRSPLAFLQTQAGINNAAGNTTINGQRTSYVNVTLDGINIQDNFIRTNDVDFLPNLLLLDQVAEVTVTSSNASSAAFGGSSQVQFVTPSGTNEFHGSAIWSNRNNYFAANSWFSNQAGTPRAFLNQNQLGGSLGGRIVKNKAFFYTNYEAFRLRQQTSQNPTILTDDARQGIYTYLVGGAPQKVNILQARGVQIDPAIQTMLALVPTGDKINNTNVGDGRRNTGGMQFLKRNNRTRDNLTVKGDFLLSTRHNFALTYNWNRDIVDRPDVDTTYNPVPSVANDGAVKLLSTAWRWSPKATLTNEARFGFNWAPALFLASHNIPTNFVSGLTFTNPINSYRTNGRNTDNYQFADNVNWVYRQHTLSLGFQSQWVRVEQYADFGITPSFGLGIGAGQTGLTAAQLPGISASDLSAANGLLATLGGFLNTYTQTYNVQSRDSGFVNGYGNVRHNKFDNYALYLQDSWKFHRRLTATLGLRWDYYTPVDERDSLALFPVLQGNNVIQTLMNPNAVLDFAGSSVGRPWYKADKNNFAPNLGLAWDPTGQGKWSVRAGYSMFYVNDNIIRAADNSQLTNGGLQSTVTRTGLTGRLSTGLPAIPAPAYKVPRTLADNYALSSTSAAAMPDPGLVTPYVQQWNLSVQRAIKGTVVEVRYIGNHATKAIRGFDYNQVTIGQMLPDFLKAQNNGLLAQRAGGSFDPRFNANIAGSQQLPFFTQLPNGGNLTNATIISNIQTGQVGELGSFYQTNLVNGPVSFFANPNILGANALTNYSNASYNALQLDVNRRFARGIQFQFNYVYSKIMSDTAGDQQTDFEPFLDINNAKLEKSRVNFADLTHVLKANGVYEFPFGPGKRFNPQNGVVSRIVQGWQFGGIMTWQSGTPFGVSSGRGTLNRAGRSANNMANTSLNKAQLDEMFGVQMTGTGPVFVPETVKGPDGRAVAADGAAPFTGQVFFQPGAGTLGGLQRNYFSGPWVFNLDGRAAKVTRIKEGHTIELAMTTTNIFNMPTWYIGNQSITSANFGKITGTFYGRRLVQFELYYKF